VLEGCQTKFVLPNPAACTPQMAAIHRRLGFIDAEIQTISQARPQRDIYYASELSGKRLYSLHLSPVLVAILARNRPEDHERMDAMLDEHGPEGFAAAWIEAQRFPQQVAQVRVANPVEAVLVCREPS
jgi:type IV secretory pathway VirB4 component